jgi:two-component system, cell cycle response regulator
VVRLPWESGEERTPLEQPGEERIPLPGLQECPQAPMFDPPSLFSRMNETLKMEVLGGKRPLRILLVEAERHGVPGLEEALSSLDRAPMELEWAESLSSALKRLHHGGVDLLLLDLDLPDSQGMETFERAHAFAPEVPIVVLTGVDDEELALGTVQGGAQDFLVKGEASPDLLLHSIRYAVERHRLMSALRSLSLIDDLTGLYNRRGFLDLGEQHLKLARRSARAVLLVYLDVDGLKTINDTLGHSMGDRALIQLANVLRDTFRQSDIIGRMGGDEFAVMALEASEENEDWLARRLRERVEKMNRSGTEPFHLSISVGLARFPAEGRPKLTEFLALADQAMYMEKRAKKAASIRGRVSTEP